MTRTLAGKTILMSGGSRGIGLAIALRAARDGANIALLAKTDAASEARRHGPHRRRARSRRAGGKALAVVGDVRNDDDVRTAVQRCGQCLRRHRHRGQQRQRDRPVAAERAEMKRYDLMQDINMRGTFLLSRPRSRTCAQADNPHILTLSPPLNLAPHWLGRHPVTRSRSTG